MNSFAKTTVLHRVLCGILGTVMYGCDEGPDANALAPTADWEGIACGANSQMDLLTGLSPTQPVDGLLLYGVGGQAGSYVREAGGPPCVTATNMSQCQQTVESLRNSLGSTALIVTKGDMVSVVSTKSEVKAFLGQLDNPQKVFVWMHVNGLALGCKFIDSAVIANEDGQSWSGVHSRITRDCSPIITERVRVNINVEDWSITETAHAESSRQSACIGRKPPGAVTFHETAGDSVYDSLGTSLARHAAYEAASVVAFLHLKEELEYFGAPQCLLDRIEKAVEDERRHARQVTMLAGRYGQAVQNFFVEPAPLRDLEAIAMDNMREGCVGESWGALVGLYQAENAMDSVIADTMRSVALDEVDHASLSWEIHDWLSEQLNNDARMQGSIGCIGFASCRVC